MKVRATGRLEQHREDERIADAVLAARVLAEAREAICVLEEERLVQRVGGLVSRSVSSAIAPRRSLLAIFDAACESASPAAKPCAVRATEGSIVAALCASLSA